MIYLIHGNDELKARKRFRAVVDSLLAKTGGTELFVVAAGDTPEQLENLIRGDSLFGAKYVIGAERLLTDLDLRALIMTDLAGLSSMPHALVMLEGELEPEIMQLIKPHAFKVEGFARLEVRPQYNIFVLTDAWASRNKKKSWILYQEALRAGLAAEEIFWKIVWQTKNLLLVKLAKDPTKLGLKPYPLQKAQENAKKFESGELQTKLARLSDLYHQSRRGEGEIETGLEQLILEI